MSIKTIYHFTDLTGGAATALDSIDGNSLLDKDRAFVIAAGVFYIYELDADSGLAESSPDVISPNTNAGTKRWILITTMSITAVTTSTTSAVNDNSTHIATTAFVQAAKCAPTNLFTNSQWMAMSGSTLCEVTSGAAPVLDGVDAALVNNLLVKGGFDDQASVDTWTEANDAVATSAATGKTGNKMVITGGVSVNPYVTKSVTTVVGKLYQFTCYIRTGTEASYLVYVGTEEAGMQYLNGSGEAADDWTTTVVTKVFEATTTTTYIMLGQAAAGGAGTTLFFDSITLYEVTPGYVASDNLAPDGWIKSYSGTRPYVYREHQGTNTKSGGFYSIRVDSKESHEYQGLLWPGGFSYSQEDWLVKFTGKQVTIGAWVKADAAGICKVGFYDNAAGYYSSANVGTDWEWLEFTRTVTATSTFAALLTVITTGHTAYFSQPILVFGSSIGSGNYQPIPIEVIWLQSEVLLTDYAGSATVSADTTINLEAQSSGKIGKGVKAVYSRLDGINNTAGQQFTLYSGTRYGVNLQTIVNSVGNLTQGIVPCDSNGDFSITRSGTWTGVRIAHYAIQT